jgi:hypothetical protein
MEYNSAPLSDFLGMLFADWTAVALDSTVLVSGALVSAPFAQSMQAMHAIVPTATPSFPRASDLNAVIRLIVFPESYFAGRFQIHYAPLSKSTIKNGYRKNKGRL